MRSWWGPNPVGLVLSRGRDLMNDHTQRKDPQGHTVTKAEVTPALYL